MGGGLGVCVTAPGYPVFTPALLDWGSPTPGIVGSQVNIAIPTGTCLWLLGPDTITFESGCACSSTCSSSGSISSSRWRGITLVTAYLRGDTSFSIGGIDSGAGTSIPAGVC